ncbi:MAG: FHA domain-containing protein [Anaerolineaceae bacterium]|nr:FHA domain-containing protein [Anaerolineaceae bacterium]
MILCPTCQHHEFSGTLFCSECGAQLTIAEPLSTHSIYRSQSDSLTSTVSQAGNSGREVNKPSSLTAYPGSSVTLRVVDGGHSLPLAGRSEYTLGRVAEGQPILPDVDLSPYEAYALGVSRLHAALKLVNQRVFVVDLGSSNGTRVNGQKIVSNVDYPLNHGDTLTLGKLKLEILTQH